MFQDIMNNEIERIKSSLQIDEDIDLHVKGWIIQRIGWALMLIVLAAAALGLFGDGVLSEKTLASDGITLIFEEFLRRECDTELEIMAGDEGGEIRVTLSAEFKDAYKIERIVPEPASHSINNGKTVLEFPANGQGQIIFFLTVRERITGSTQHTVTVNSTEFALNNYIYP